MDDYINELLIGLSSRLPELQWKINRLNSPISSSQIPQGLFRCATERIGDIFIEEIKSDIQMLSHQKNTRCAHFMANQIRQKVNVLVTLCQMDSKKAPCEKKLSFDIDTLSTRQQWIQSLEVEIEQLMMQEKAMEKALDQAKLNIDKSIILSLQSELGEVTRRLTLAKETLSQVIS